MASSSSGAQTVESSAEGQQLQMRILEQLQKVTGRLDQVEDKMAAATQQVTPDSKLCRVSFLETIRVSKICTKSSQIDSSSSSDESDTPNLELLRSRKLQKKVDKRVRELDQNSHDSGSVRKVKSKRGAVLRSW